MLHGLRPVAPGSGHVRAGCIAVGAALRRSSIRRRPFRNQSPAPPLAPGQSKQQEGLLDSIIYLVGLVVVVMAILSFLGLR